MQSSNELKVQGFKGNLIKCTEENSFTKWKKHIRVRIYLKLKIVRNWERIWRKYSTIQSWLGYSLVSAYGHTGDWVFVRLSQMTF